MGKPTGFIEYLRELPVDRTPPKVGLEIHESAPEMGFTPNVILQLHGMLYRYHAGASGRWKMAQNEIVERNPDGTVRRVRFVPVQPVATPHAMDQLADGYARARDAERHVRSERKG